MLERPGRVNEQWAMDFLMDTVGDGRRLRILPVIDTYSRECVRTVENAYMESFNARLRDECLNQHWFLTIGHARQVIEQWRVDYN